ncbi:unnamed protein product (macronuclear) [Paramecium tetraurelia]|uniref:Uncharacterized protein n=1 Tax=Paramecium tetraurelia TaxID=5888 RepID=A0CCF0_PARTE|nr:uncharacterized protein GSPATT00037252001 [Paramecium tetraurelia]CAK68467.1 unnamed protein product [Paramecium tetraurelia]|eukprot:XP_001435864.1 hypothetical protein (macronuclear) [Paramecium tetraurelia strain d4-2]
MNRSRRQELLQLVNKKRSFLSPQMGKSITNKPFRRQSCRCTECGGVGPFQERQNAQHPQTYIRAHHCKKRKRRMQRRKGTYLTSTSLNVGQSENNTIILQNAPKLRKAKTISITKELQQTIRKGKRLLTKDDQQIKYEFFYNNELQLSKGFLENSSSSQTYEAALISFVNFTKSPSFVLNSYNNIINESKTSSDDEQHQKHLQDKQLQFTTPKIKIKNNSMHSRKLTEGMMHPNINKTVQQFVQSCTTIRVLNSPKPSKQIKLPSINSKREQSKFSVYLLSSPRRAVMELKSQITSQKKIKVLKK